jgi:hypothetical protein
VRRGIHAVITADELTRMIEAEAHLSLDPPVSDEALQDAAAVALNTFGGSDGTAHLTTAA